MSSNAPQSGIPITDGMLSEFDSQVILWLTSLKGNLAHLDKAKSADKVGLRRDGSSMADGVTTEVSSVNAAKVVSKNPFLFADGVHRTLTAVKKGLTIGIHIAELYARASNLDALTQEKRRGGMSSQREAELQAKYQTASTIALYASAYYIVWDLNQCRPEEVTGIRMDLPSTPQLLFSAPLAALSSMVFHWSALLERSGLVNSELQYVKMTHVFFKSVIDNVLERVQSLAYAEPFTGTTYQLVGTQFSIAGFKSDFGGTTTSVEFKRVELESIVGNRGAKHFVRRLAQRVVCYDPEVKKNVFHEIGSISRIAMGFGPPGTGKSMLIGATATIMRDYCEQLGLPFSYHPFPDTIVSTFQGGSAERAAEWFKPLADSSRIVYAPIDDAENNLEDRTRQGVSAGVREVIGVFLRKTEGAEAIDRGNTSIHVFTNIPDQIDPAVRSRIVSRFLIDGAKTAEDFLDQDYLWWRRYTKLDPAFVNLADPAHYVYLSDQQDMGNLGELYEQYTEPQEQAVKDVLARVDRTLSRTDHHFYASLYAAFQKAYPFFTSRDVRNIQSAISERITDFDLPEDWFNKPDTFFKKPYETRKAMLIELMKSSMQGLKMADIRYQESIRYLDGWVKIQDQGFERKVVELLEQQRVVQEGARRLERNSGGKR